MSARFVFDNEITSLRSENLLLNCGDTQHEGEEGLSSNRMLTEENEKMKMMKKE